MVMEALSESNAQCLNHPFKNSSPGGGICAFCLQEKLGKLVSSSTSSFPSTVFPSSGSSSSSPSFRSENASAIAVKSSEPTAAKHHQPTGRSRFPFQPAHKATNKNQMGKMNFPPSDAFSRSKSTAAASRTRVSFLDEEDKSTYYDSPRRRRGGFWSFLHSSKNPSNTRKAVGKKDSNFSLREKKREESTVVVADDDDDDVDEKKSSSPYDIKVSRSRSVGCGSKRFSNDLFERISNGFGDCALRRVESHREGKSSRAHAAARNSCVGMIGHDFIKERVRCGGIFSGFVHVSSSSPSSSSSYSSYVGGKLLPPSSAASSHGRSKSWGWALASPMRAFGGKKSSSYDVKNVAAPNLDAVPSILAAASGSVKNRAYA